MNSRTSLRFDYVALVAIAVCVTMLYGIVLGERLARVPTPAVIGAPAAPPDGSAPVDRAPDRAAMASPPAAARIGHVADARIDDLSTLFQRAGYELDRIRRGVRKVPPILVDRVPIDLASLASPGERKRLFIKLALPLVLTANQRILDDRERLMALRQRMRNGVRSLGPRDSLWIARMHARYGLDRYDLDALLERMDIVPPSLALAQAAEESGWGTSRFVREGNALFGQHTYKPGQGLVPARRDPGNTHEVRIFNRLLDSVASYMFNLNSHPAYREFRRARAIQRRSRGSLDGFALVATLTRYSERGGAYIKTIRSIIETNGLAAFDQASLDGRLPFDRRDPAI